MSIGFSDFNDPLVVLNPANRISSDLGFGALTNVNVVTNAAPAIPNTAVPPALANQLAYVAARWGRALESERRILIDAFVQAILEPMAAPGIVPGGPVAPGVIPAVLRVTAEQNVAAGLGHTGHGRYDYLIASPIFNIAGNPTANNEMRPGLIIEAKANLGGGGAFGQWQLCAELATAYQLAAGLRRRTRGVLSDGRFWRFYELDCLGALPVPVLTRTNAYDTAILADRDDIVRLLQRFIVNYLSFFAFL